MQDKTLLLPSPMINDQEKKELKVLQKKYIKMTQPNKLVKVGKKAARKLPASIKDLGSGAKDALSEAVFIKESLKVAAKGFQELERIASKMTLSEKQVLKRLNRYVRHGYLSSLEDVCFVRAYHIERVVSRYKDSSVLLAAVEGAGTGAFGFVGLVPNIVLSTFLYFRAVQSVAICYGYDVKHDPNEMEIASAVLMSALSPGNDSANNELTSTIGKFMVFSEVTAVKQTSKKTWAAMIDKGGVCLLIAQIRALSNKAAQNALKKAGAKGLEESVFRGILEQLSKKLSLKATGNAMPIVGGVFGAFFDSGQMSKIVNYANIFYYKRFVEEKEVRINYVLDPDVAKYDVDLESSLTI